MRRVRLAVDVERQQVDVCHFKQMPGFSAWRRTRVEQALASERFKDLHRTLGAGVLDRNQSVGEARQGIDRDRLVEDQSIASQRPGRQACLLQACRIISSAWHAAD
jgi:hypothetical protein